jgi:hypothetical protein
VGRKVKQVKKHLTKLTKLHKNEALKNSHFSRANLVIFAVIFVTIGGYLIYSSFAAPTCTQTFTTSTVGSNPFPGSSVNTAIQNGSGSTVICFAAGNYGEIDVYAAHPSGIVTIQPTPGAAVNMGLFNLNGVSNVKIDGFSGV